MIKKNLNDTEVFFCLKSIIYQIIFVSKNYFIIKAIKDIILTKATFHVLNKFLKYIFNY